MFGQVVLTTDVTGTLPVGNGGTGGATAAAAKTALGFMSRYAQNYGDGAALSYTITHNLNTLDVQVCVFRNSDGVEVEVDVTHATVNTITVAHAVAPTSNAVPRRRDRLMARPRLGATTAPVTQAFGDAPSAGTPGDNLALASHRHGMPAAPGGGALTDHTHEVTGSGATGGGGTVKPSTLWIPGQSPVKWHASTGSGLWFENAAAAQRFFLGLADSDDTLLRIYSPLSPAGNKFTLDLDTGNVGVIGNLSVAVAFQSAYGAVVAVTDPTLTWQRQDNSIAQGDVLGVLNFHGLDTGSVARIGARILVLAAGPNGATFVPGALWFYTVDATGAGGYRWEMNGSGHWVPITTDVMDIGAASKRVRSVYTGAVNAGASYLWLESSGQGLVWNSLNLYKYGGGGSLGLAGSRWGEGYIDLIDFGGTTPTILKRHSILSAGGLNMEMGPLQDPNGPHGFVMGAMDVEADAGGYGGFVGLRRSGSPDAHYLQTYYEDVEFYSYDEMGNDYSADQPGIVFYDKASDARTPGSGRHTFYAKAGGLYVRDSAGVVVGPLGSAGSPTSHAALSGITATDHHAAPVAGPDANTSVDAAGAAGTAGAFARSGHGHQLVTSAAAPAAIGAASAGTAGTAPSRGNHVHATGAGTPSTQAFGDAAAIGSGPAGTMFDHKHAMPANPVTAHEAAADPHTGYQRELGGKDVAPAIVNVNSVTSVNVINESIPNVAAGDTVHLDAWLQLLNNSGAARVYVITVGVGPVDVRDSLHDAQHRGARDEPLGHPCAGGGLVPGGWRVQDGRRGGHAGGRHGGPGGRHDVRDDRRPWHPLGDECDGLHRHLSGGVEGVEQQRHGHAAGRAGVRAHPRVEAVGRVSWERSSGR